MPASYQSLRTQQPESSLFVGVSRFFRWWGRELADLVPARLRPMPRAISGFLWLEFIDHGMVVVRHTVRGREEIGRLDIQSVDAQARKMAFEAIIRRYRRLPIGISVPASQVLRKSIKLPIAAKDDPYKVLGFELNRHTPFHSEQAYFDYSVVGEDSKAGKLEVLLTVVPRAAVEEGLQMLRAWKHAPQAIVVADELAGKERYANLLPSEWRPGVSLSRKLMYVGVCLFAFLLLCVALGLPLWQKREVALALDERVQQAKQRAASIEALRQELEVAIDEYQHLLEKKLARPAAVELLEELTKLLPDTTWLTQLEVKGGEMIFSGATNSSANLIRLLEKSTLLEDAAFRSPLVKGRDSGERFQMAAHIKPRVVNAKPTMPADGEVDSKTSKPAVGQAMQSEGVSRRGQP